MIDFRGWWSNWDWSGATSGTPPSWLHAGAVLGGYVGLVLTLRTWSLSAPSVPAWVAGAIVLAVVIEVATLAILEEWRTLTFAYGIAVSIAGVFALGALEIEIPTVRNGFAVYAPCLTLAVGPLTSRATAATLFAYEMVGYAKDQQEQLRAALAGEVSALVVRIERVDGMDVDLLTLGKGEEQTLRTSWSVLDRRPLRSPGAHLLIEEPTIGDVEDAGGYRDTKRSRRLMACKKTVYLGGTPTVLPASVYWDEVRAGIVFVTVEHAVVAGAAWLIALRGR